MTKSHRTILIVEDEKTLREAWERNIAEFNSNKDSKVHFTPLIASNLSEAYELLSSRFIDCAILDYKLPTKVGEDPNTEHGKSLISAILNEYPIPLALYSALAAEASQTEIIRKSPIKIYEKEGENSLRALEWLAEHNPLMAALAENNNQIRRAIAHIFCGAIWPRWSETKTIPLTAEEQRIIIARQVVSHIGEHLSLDESARHHAEEFYFKPPMREKLHTGDMLLLKDTVYVIVNPQCDMVNKVESYLLAECTKVHDWEAIKSGLKDAKKSESAERALRNYANQGHGPASHFLPPCALQGPWLAQFRKVISYPLSEKEALLSARFASIAPAFIPNLTQRFSNYLSRIGQPDLDIEVLKKHMLV